MSITRIITIMLSVSVAACAAEVGESVEPELAEQGLQAQDTFIFENLNSHRCLGVDRASSSPGAALKQFTCDCRANQSWIIDDSGSVPNGIVLRNANSKLCVGTNGGSTRPGTAVMQFGCDGRPNQQWLRDLNDAQKTVRFRNSLGSCMGVDRGSGENGAAIQLFGCDGKANQQWKVRFTSSCLH